MNRSDGSPEPTAHHLRARVGSQPGHAPVIRFCRIADVAQRILMHGAAYSIEGLMAAMFAELVCVIPL
jgi:hypothetical protein